MYWDTFVQVSGSDFTTGTTLSNITGLLYTAAANSLYEIEVHLVGQSSSSAGNDFTIAFSAAGATGTFTYYGPGGTTTGIVDSNVLGTVTGTGLWTTASTDTAARILAGVKTGANTGDITVQVQNLTAGTAKIYIGSVFNIKKLA